MKSTIKKISPFFVSILTLFISASGYAWYGGSIGFGFAGPGFGPGFYGPGPGYYGGPEIIVSNVIVPNVIVTRPVPVRRYYVPEYCDDVEVCDSYGECWIEQYCN